jgi:predicted ATPase
VRTALVYVALGWGAVEVTSTMGQVFEWPGWLVRSLVVAIFLGLPVAIAISWMFDLTPEGLLPEEGAPPSIAPTDVAGAEGPRPSVTEGPRISNPPPHPTTPLLGREEAIETAATRLRSDVRVLTITGTGGTGKTRFSIELFERLQSEYPGGAAFVSLASIEEAEDVMPHVGAVLDVAEAHGRSAVAAVATAIGDTRTLLILDNLEQVLGVAGEIAELVSLCPRLQVIATSRAPLKIGAEIEFPLPPLALPPEGVTAPEDLSLYPAVELFTQRATKVKPDFGVTADNAPAIVGICRRLDGLPLALELAAARIRILDPKALLDRLDHALDILTSGDRDLPERQRTLRATVEWSYDLLDEGERRLLLRLSTFSEGWTYGAMEAVCYAGTAANRSLDELDSLVEKGLVQVEGPGDRYLLLVTIREFAADRLESEGDAEEVREAHAAYFVTLCREVHEGITGRTQLEAMRRARADNANTFAALQWLTARAREGDGRALEQALLIAGYQNWVWHITGQHLTARAAVDDVLMLAQDAAPSLGRSLALATAGMVSISTGEMGRGLEEWTGSYEDARLIGDEAAMAQAGVGIGFTHVIEGRVDEARGILEETIERSERIGEEFMQAVAIEFLGTVCGISGDLDEGIALVEKGQAISVRIGDYEGGGVGLSFLAHLYFMKGESERALEHYRSALVALETVGDRPEIARVHGEMGWAALSMERVVEARTSFLNSIRWYDEVGSARGVGTGLMGLAVAEASDGHPERAARIAAAADVLADQAGVVVVHAMGIGAGDRIEALRATFDAAHLASLTEGGRAMSPPEIIAMVKERNGRPRHSEAPHPGEHPPSMRAT